MLLFILVFQDPHNTTYATRSMFGKQMVLEKLSMIDTVILRLYLLRANHDIYFLQSGRDREAIEGNGRVDPLCLKIINKIASVYPLTIQIWKQNNIRILAT